MAALIFLRWVSAASLRIGPAFHVMSRPDGRPLTHRAGGQRSWPNSAPSPHPRQQQVSPCHSLSPLPGGFLPQLLPHKGCSLRPKQHDSGGSSPRQHFSSTTRSPGHQFTKSSVHHSTAPSDSSHGFTAIRERQTAVQSAERNQRRGGGAEPMAPREERSDEGKEGGAGGRGATWGGEQSRASIPVCAPQRARERVSGASRVCIQESFICAGSRRRSESRQHSRVRCTSVCASGAGGGGIGPRVGERGRGV